MSSQRVYRARAKQWALGESSTGKEQASILFDITTPEADIQSITAYLYFTDATWHRSVESLRHCGWEGADIAELSGLDANEVELVVEDETYEGKTHARVKWINRIGGLDVKAPLVGDKLRAFSATMQNRIHSMGAPTTKPKARVTTQAQPLGYGPPPLTDDDINF